MKMLTDQQIDYHAARVIANDHEWQEHLSVIIAQAKLAYTIQQKAAKICKEQKVSNEDGNDCASGHNFACDECHDAILAMEIPE